MDKKLGEDDQDTLALWGMSMDWYARFLLETNRKSEALTCFKKAYEMCVRVNGMEHEQTVILLNDLGTVSTLVGDNESALNYLEQAKKIGEKFPEMKDLPAIHVNLGLLYLLRQMYKESKLACQEGMKMAKSQEDEVAFLEAKLCLDKIKNALQESKISNQTKQSQLLVN